MTQYFRVYYMPGTDEIVAVYTNNEEQPLSLDVLHNPDVAYDRQDFSVETETYIPPKELFTHVRKRNGALVFQDEAPRRPAVTERTDRQTQARSR